MNDKQKQNVKEGCKKRNPKSIINAQKKRHLKAKINDLIIKQIKNTKNLEHIKNWVQELETITEITALNALYEEIQNQQ